MDPRKNLERFYLRREIFHFCNFTPRLRKIRILHIEHCIHTGKSLSELFQEFTRMLEIHRIAGRESMRAERPIKSCAAAGRSFGEGVLVLIMTL